MKEIDDLTLRELRELKEQYINEFKEIVKHFFEERPLISIIHLYYNYRKELGLWPIDSKTKYFGSSIPLTIDRLNSTINDITLKNEKL